MDRELELTFCHISYSSAFRPDLQLREGGGGVQGCDVWKETDKDAERVRKYVDAVLGMLDPMTRSAKAQEPVSFRRDLASCMYQRW